MKKYLPKTFKNNSGFTLIELLVALTIITILAVAVYVALNPAKRLSESEDARRTQDVNSILTAIHQSVIDNKGNLPTNLANKTNGNEYLIGAPEGNTTNCPASVGTKCTALTAGCADLMAGGQNLTSYLATVPVDPDETSVNKTGYSVKKDANGIITVKACHTNATAAIQVSR